MAATRTRAACAPAVPVLAAAWLARPALAQEHGGMAGGTSLSGAEILAALAHGAAQGAAVFLAGLAAFAALVAVPALRAYFPEAEKVGAAFRRPIWVLAGLLLLAGAVEVPVFAARASGETLSPGLLAEALFGTRVGNVWIARAGFGLLAAALASYASRRRSPGNWLVAFGVATVMMLTFSQQSHAAAEARLLPLAADWLHVTAASVWVGGLLGFPLLLLGPLRAMPAEERAEALGRTVRRFSTVASVAVAAIVLTGSYAALLDVPDLRDLVTTPYGRALIMKLGLVAFMFPIAAINLLDRGRGPFGRMVGAELALAFGVFVATGFLTTLPPP